MTALLKVSTPESMDPDTLVEWSKNAATAASQACSEARSYFERMKKHYDNVTELMSRLQMLREEQGPGWQDEAQEIVDTWLEIIDAMGSLALERTDDHVSMQTLEDDERELLETGEGRAAAMRVDQEARAFLLVYTKHKARLGLKTQDDVARLTGINRRHISAIERGAHKPQFRTIKRLADAFSVDVTEFMTR